ncbi:uncharacterized protein PAC_01346 [Phialocephala subalpina]|uniref:Cell wall glycoprotein n=1 Tax=Phialocephala subalpina TaxID=576137 RepID=A0A1L7WFB5_9HELO|nr:uncharacterized protein PAC_01346 [Phialocephala subalpina]
MVARSHTLLAGLALTASATQWSNTTTTAETVIYTTVCSATSIMTSGTKIITSIYTTTSTITSCKGGCPTASATPDCEKVYADCQSKPDANQATCAALYAQCAVTTSGLNKPAPSSTSSSATPSSTADCEKVREECQSKPDANQSYCASLYVQCAGTTSGLNKPAPSPTSSAPNTTATADCGKVRSDCQSKPDANQAVCAALYVKCAGTTSGLNKPPAETTQETTIYATVCPATSTYTSGTETHTPVFSTTSTITSCKGGCVKASAPAPSSTSPVDYCQDQLNKCRGTGDPNEAVCAAQFAACKGGASSGSASASSAPATKPAETYPASSVPATSPVASKPAESKPAESKTQLAESHPAQPSAKTTLATSSATTPVQQTSTPSGSTPSTPEFTGAASAVKVGYMGLAGVAALAFL